MVIQERLSEEPESAGTDEEVSDEDGDSDAWQDDNSTTSQDDKNCMDIIPADETSGNFGNIVVKNSSEVHFGNKTFYQGPVTIKQFLYNNAPNDTKLCIEQNGIDNPELVTDSVCGSTDNSGANNAHIINNTINGLPDIKNKCDAELEKGGSKWINYVRRNYKLLLFCIGVLLAMFLILLTITLVTKHVINNYPNAGGPRYPTDSSEQDYVGPVTLPQDPESNVTLSGKLRIITRQQWVAQPPYKPATKLNTPVPYVIILHTATDNCSDQATCVFHVRYIQSFHIDSNGWWDIGYNFLVGGDGFAYEGRGWTSEGAFTYGYNSRAIGIAFIGTFNDIMPPQRQILAAKQLIELGVKKGYIAPNYKLFAHRQLSSTQSPGHLLYEDIKTWPHWASKPDDNPIDAKT